MPIAVRFGGFFAGVTAMRLFAFVAAGGKVSSLTELAEMFATVAAAFVGFGTLAFAVKVAGMPIFSKDE